MPRFPRLPLGPIAVGLAALALVACETTGGPRPGGRGPVVTDRELPPEEVPQINEEDFVSVPQRDADSLVRVALLLPFTHSSENIEAVSNSMLKAAQMVAFESENERYLLIPKDTNGTPEGARAVARDALEEGAEVILGPLFADSVEVVSRMARPLGVPVIAFSTDSAVAGNGVYLLSFPPEAEVARVTQYATEMGYGRFGLMAPNSEFGDRVASAFSQEVFSRGGEIIHSERYDQSADAMIAPAKRMSQYAARTFEPVQVTPRITGLDANLAAGAQALMAQDDDSFRADEEPGMSPIVSSGEGYQAVLLPEQGRLLRALAPLFPYNNVNINAVKLLGLSAWNNPLLTREPALNGGWFAAPDPSLAEGFKRRYRAAYGENPARLASLAYDAALLTARLSELPARNRFAPETIANPSGYLGADGLFRLRVDGMVERGLAILEIRPEGIRVIDPAPRSFAPSTGF